MVFFIKWSMLSKSYCIYSGDLKADPSKTGNICKPDFWKIGFKMVSVWYPLSHG